MPGLKEQIATLEKALKSPVLPEDLKGDMKKKLEELQDALKKADPPIPAKPAPPKQKKAKTKKPAAKLRARQSAEDSKKTEDKYKKRRARSLDKGVRKPLDRRLTDKSAKPAPSTTSKVSTELQEAREMVQKANQIMSRLSMEVPDEAKLRAEIKADLLKDKDFIAGIKKDVRKEVKAEILANLRKLKKGGKTARGSKK
ncbi:MAG: hypothetical protein COA79_20230 [Planctomycetota bacterium]|nr:MAG: hypothetical protein COA79_20230 [Planctomycetota bacterium]